MDTDKAKTGAKTRKSRNNVSGENDKVSENAGLRQENDGQQTESSPPIVKLGRPTIFTQELADHICDRIANGESLRAICRDDIIPPAGTILRWVTEKQAFREQYENAMEQRADGLFEEILEIADETDNDTVYTDQGDKPNSEWISRSRLRVDARKWILSKMVPKKYGDRQTVDMNVSNPVADRLARARKRNAG